MKRWRLAVSVLVLTGCPTMKEVSYTIVPEEGLATLRMHDVRTDDGSDDDWLMAAGLLSLFEGADLVDDLVRYEEVDGGLDVVATLKLDAVGLAALLPRTHDVGLWCSQGAILRTNGHDLTSTLGVPCVAWEPGQSVLEVVVAGDATDDQPSVLDDWKAAGAPAEVQAEED